jgi:hypothetical protein
VRDPRKRRNPARPAWNAAIEMIPLA